MDERIRQHYPTKYIGQTFEQKLETSQDLVNEIGNILIDYGFIVRMQDDAKPFIFPDKTKIRGLDIFCSYKGKSYFIDAKDYGRLFKYNSTGIELKYYERYEQIQDYFGIDIIIMFKDIAEAEKMTLKYNKNAKLFKSGGKSVPYGDFLNLLKENEAASNVLTRKGKKQKIWFCDEMKSVHGILDDITKVKRNKICDKKSLFDF